MTLNIVLVPSSSSNNETSENIIINDQLDAERIDIYSAMHYIIVHMYIANHLRWKSFANFKDQLENEVKHFHFGNREETCLCEAG